MTDLSKLEQFKEDIARDSEVTEQQREQANEDMRFVNVTGGMWEDFLTNEFEGRTKLELNIASNYFYRNIGEWNQNRIGVEYKPDDSETSENDADLMNGIYRADFRQNSGKCAIDSAVYESTLCGIAAYKIATRFVDDEDPENDDQRIEFRVIPNAYNTVYWDNAAKRVDKQDARHCTELMMFTDKSYEERWPNAAHASAFTPQSRFFTGDDFFAPNIIYVGVRYQVVQKKENVFIYNNLQSGKIEAYSEKDHEDIKDELRKDDFRAFVRQRKINKQHVEKTVFSGQEILEKTKRIAGKWIPIIPMYGYRAFVDSAEYYHGLIRNLKDAARLFNMQVSQLAENSASNGQEVPIFTPEQISGFENDWADLNNKPYLLLNPSIDKDGNILQTAPTAYLKPSQLDGSTAALMSIVPEFVKDITGNFPQETKSPDESGKAIREARKIEDLNTQILADNRSVSIQWGGVVYASIAAEIYNTKRMVNTIGVDDIESQEQLLKTVVDEETGRLVEANDLKGKKFKVYSDVGPQYETLRADTVDTLKSTLTIISSLPGGEQYIPPILSMIFDNMSGVGLGPLKDLNRKNMILQGLVKPKTDAEKELLAQAQQPQEDPNQELIEAATQQQLSEARNLDAASLEKAASAQLKSAQSEKVIADTQKVFSDMAIDQKDADINKVKTLIDIRKQVFVEKQSAFENLQQLPLSAAN